MNTYCPFKKDILLSVGSYGGAMCSGQCRPNGRTHCPDCGPITRLNCLSNILIINARGAVKSLANSGHFTVGHSSYKMVRGTMLLVAFDLTLLFGVPLVLQSGPFVGYFSPTNFMWLVFTSYFVTELIYPYGAHEWP